VAKAALVVSIGVLFVGGCGGDADEAADTSAASTAAPSSEPLVIRTSLIIATAYGSEPIATGEVLEGSTLGDSPFCIDGTILDSHKSPDAAAEPYGPVYRTVTCPTGTVALGLTPDVTSDEPQGEPQKGSWTIVGGTAAFETLRGSGKMETVYGRDERAPVRETLTGTVTR
jgi:hypothetical protein